MTVAAYFNSAFWQLHICIQSFLHFQETSFNISPGAGGFEVVTGRLYFFPCYDPNLSGNFYPNLIQKSSYYQKSPDRSGKKNVAGCVGHNNAPTHVAFLISQY